MDYIKDLLKNPNHGLILDGVAASSAIDSSGEILDVDGCDISSLESGDGVLNFEHKSEKDSGASFNDVVGRVVFAKKIRKLADCDTDREKMYWNKVKLPFIYHISELFDADGHPGAVATAAIIRHYNRRGLPILIRYSIEGSTLERDGNKLTKTIARRIAMTQKPCNKTSISGVIEDKGDIKAEPVLKFEHPDKMKVSSYELEYSSFIEDPFTTLGTALDNLKAASYLAKTLAAGGYNAAPGNLVGGSALQKENLTLKKWKNQGLAALRDYSGTGEFKTFLKHRLPDCSEEFLDRFSALVDDYQIKKTEKLEEDLAKAMKAKQNKALTINGEAVKPNRRMPEHDAQFDENSGTLRIPEGNFKMYIPSQDSPQAKKSFDDILNDPKVDAYHTYAIKNWLRLHSLLKKGNLPESIVKHAAIFSILSQNKPVPTQELMYSHFFDAEKETGSSNPREPISSETLANWRSKDSPDTFPKHSADYWTEPAVRDSLILQRPSKLTGRQPGEIYAFALAGQAQKAMGKYHKLHEHLVKLVNTHKEDGRAASGELMENKTRVKNWQSTRNTAIAAGKDDPGDYPHGAPEIGGLAPKTSRYALAMMGAGNTIVPDTHFIRYLFGLNKETDTPTIEKLKSVLWNTTKTHVLDGIDRYYFKNHDAVKHILNHPKLGQHFDNPEQAIFPAFWKNWMAIIPHEHARGHRTGGFNELTTHKPFWDAINEVAGLPPIFFNKSEAETDLPTKTAGLMHHWVQKYGEIPALMMYYTHIVPQLLHDHDKPLAKMESLTVNLLKATNELAKLPDLGVKLPDTARSFGGKVIDPGEIELAAGPMKGSKLKLLNSDHEHIFVEPFVAGPEGNIGVTKMLRNQEGKHFIINRQPRDLNLPNFVHGEEHPIPSVSGQDYQKALMHGIDLTNKHYATGGAHGLTMDQAEPHKVVGWFKNASGQLGFVKPQMVLWKDALKVNSPDYISTPKREAIFHNTARDFWGLGEHVPATAAFRHPHTKEDYSVMAHVPNARHIYNHKEASSSPELMQLGQSGQLDKMAIMDSVMGSNDRHRFNYMLSPDKAHVHLIDNALIFDNSYAKVPTYLTDYLGKSQMDEDTTWGNTQVPQETIQWLNALNPEHLRASLRNQGVSDSVTDKSVKVLENMKRAASEPGLTRRQLYIDSYMYPEGETTARGGA